MTNPANIVTQKINESPKCNLQGLINRTNSIINAAWLSEMLRFFILKFLTALIKPLYNIACVIKPIAD